PRDLARTALRCPNGGNPPSRSEASGKTLRTCQAERRAAPLASGEWGKPCILLWTGVASSPIRLAPISTRPGQRIPAAAAASSRKGTGHGERRRGTVRASAPAARTLPETALGRGSCRCSRVAEAIGFSFKAPATGVDNNEASGFVYLRPCRGGV